MPKLERGKGWGYKLNAVLECGHVVELVEGFSVDSKGKVERIECTGTISVTFGTRFHEPCGRVYEGLELEGFGS